MRSVVLGLVGCLAVWCLADRAPVIGAQGAAPGRADASARITGIVRAADSGRPLAETVVYLSNTETGTAVRSVVTSTDGRFDFQQLPAGRYWVTFSRPGWPRVIYGQRRPGRAGRPIDVVDGQVAADLTASLLPGGALTGTVIAPDNEPAVHVTVGAYRFAYVDGVRQLQFASGADVYTDDRGVYRISGLDSGEYFIGLRVPRTAEMSEPSTAASPTHTSIFNGDMLFYPGTPTFATAEPVKLAAGEERAGLDVRLSPGAVTTVSGTVTGPDLKKASAILLLAIEGNPPLSNMRADAKSDGTFQFSGVPAGSYMLVAHMLSLAGAMEPMHLSVAGKPVVNVQVQLQSTRSMTGQVVWRGRPARPAPRAGSCCGIRGPGSTASRRAMPLPRADRFASTVSSPAITTSACSNCPWIGR